MTLRDERSLQERAATLIAVLGLGLGLAALAITPVHADEADQIAELLELQPGLRVADVGAGDGEFGEALARRLGASGHLYLNEIDDGELIKLRRLLERSDLGNMSLVVGEADDSRLPQACCEAILLRLVYHHMSHPDAMRASLHRSLRPGGLLLVIEMDDEDHGTPIERLVSEWSADGFEVVAEHLDWHRHGNHYAILFRRSE